MNIYDDEWNQPTHERIKPKQLVKIPYCFMMHGLSALDEYIKLSPALDYLKMQGCLVTMTYNSHALFYCDCIKHLKIIDQNYSENMKYCPLPIFEDHMTKLNRKTSKVRKKKKLKELLTDPDSNGKQRAEDILRLIRDRQKKRGDDNE